ncbi:MAG: hypothetical protein NC355_05175 [Blautia sp.]|nr:hypothetical protein [Blautia sp.]
MRKRVTRHVYIHTTRARGTRRRQSGTSPKERVVRSNFRPESRGTERVRLNE